MDKRKIFAFDIDGTMLGSDRKPLDSTREALDKLRKKGHLVTIATGRSRFMAESIIRDLNFSNYILCNGAAGFLDHEQYYQHLLEEEALTRLAADIEEKELGFAYVGLDDVKKNTEHRLEQMITAMGSINFEAPKFDQTFRQENDIYQALAFYDASFEGTFEPHYPEFRFVRWHQESVDIVPKGGSKAATLLHLAETVGIDRSNVIVFGDGENDREMLREAGVGVAMGNAQPHIQQEADIVTDTNDRDGIWKALKEMNAI